MMRKFISIFVLLIVSVMASCSEGAYAIEVIKPVIKQEKIVVKESDKKTEKPRESDPLMFYYMATTPDASKAVSPH